MKPKASRHSNHYLKYTGMVFQLFVLLALLIYFGQWLDEKFDLSNDYFTAFLPILGLILYFIRVYYDLVKE